MTKCVIRGEEVLHQGEWDYQSVEIMSIGELESVPPLIENGFAIYNPLPAGAIETDMALAWTADDKTIVLATSPLAVRPIKQ